MQTGTGNRPDYERNQYDYRRNSNINHDRRNDGRNNNEFRGGGNFNSRTKHKGNREYDRRNDDENWRSSSSNLRRDFRQASEPRIVNQNLDRNHSVRDTRSVEPLGPPRNWKQDKFHPKPPSGRRNSTISLGSDTPKLSKPPPNFDSLPPRFRNKYLKNNGFDTNSEESWDGTSVTFQGTSGVNFHNKHNFSVDNSVQGIYGKQNQLVNSNKSAPQFWSQTIPNVRGRGRGRLRQEDLDIDRLCQQFSRSGGDDKIGNQQVSKSRPDTLDWSEEVELYAEIEEGISDAVTRSSSMASLNDPQSSVQIPKDKRNNRRRNRKKGEGRNGQTRDRSTETVVREHQPRNTSRDRNLRIKGGYQSRDNSRTRNTEYHAWGNNENYRNQKPSRRNSRDSSGERSRRNSEKDIDMKNWREEIRDRCNNTTQKETKKDTDVPKTSCQAPGILILPRDDGNMMAAVKDIARQSTSYRQNQSSQNQQHSNLSVPSQQKRLFDHHNPNKPIVVNTTSSRTSLPEQANLPPNDSLSSIDVNTHGISYITDQFGNVRPPWYDPDRSSRHNNERLKIDVDVEIADLQLQWILKSGEVIRDWNKVMTVRTFLQESLITLLKTDLKFCEIENVEHHYWKILYYNIIEVLKKNIQSNSEDKDESKQYLYMLMDEGTEYFKNLLRILEQTYRFKLEDFLGSNSYPQPKGLAYVGLALVSAQKMCIFLGDLARYKEQLNDTPNYRIAREHYMNAQQLNPKNGRPYYQLAIIANYVRRRLDAVYYYMRSLMTSNPFSSARESLVQLFDDIRRRYEQSERKRREEKAERNKLHMKERERTTPGGNSLRREIWIHPEGGRRVHRTTSTQSGVPYDSDEEDLSKLDSTDVYKRFVISYLHALGKLITKIGMETFQEAAIQMLKEFRALIQHSPLPLDSQRLLKLLTLNMFAIESTQLKDAPLDSRYRSEVQECALVVSLQMFNLILEGCITLLKEQLENQNDAPLPRIVGEDLQVLLPAIKVWCDWMLCHKAIWNPPPSCSDYKVGSQVDIWTRLAILMNLLEKLNYKHVKLTSVLEEGYEMVRLPEDAMLCGFTPLMCNPQDPMYASKEIDIEISQVCLRINRILFFGTEFLCGITPPVLKLQKFESGYSEYISVVRASQKEDNSSAPDLSSDSDLLLESFSEDEEMDDKVKMQKTINVSDATKPEEIRELLQRKEELERRQKTQERHRERVQAILHQSHVSVEIEVKPRLLVPDTNCFIDYLSSLKLITAAQINAQPIYTLDVPLVVFNELEGLARGGKTPAPVGRTTLDPAHIAKVAEAAKLALEFLRSRSPAVRCVTSRGAVVPLHLCTLEEDFDQDVGVRNDDRILATSLSLCRNISKDQQSEDGPRRIYREVVLLTDDRNLRVKALARDVPVRELPDFMKWAGLG